MGEKILILIIAREINPLVPSSRVIYKDISSVWKGVTQVTSMLVVCVIHSQYMWEGNFPMPMRQSSDLILHLQVLTCFCLLYK